MRHSGENLEKTSTLLLVTTSPPIQVLIWRFFLNGDAALRGGAPLYCYGAVVRSKLMAATAGVNPYQQSFLLMNNCIGLLAEYQLFYYHNEQDC